MYLDLNETQKGLKGVYASYPTNAHVIQRNLIPTERADYIAKTAGTRVGLCGQAPSDYPDFARFLVEQGIDSISFNPDALLKGIENINQAAKKAQPAI